jgi:hypothetical protein
LLGYSMGTVNMSLVSPREVFKSAILSNAAGIMLVHNHPSGNPTPSRADLELTKTLWEAARIMDIPLLDHIILGRDGVYCSFLTNGFLPAWEEEKRKVAEKKGGIMGDIKACQRETRRQEGGRPEKGCGDRGR